MRGCFRVVAWMAAVALVTVIALYIAIIVDLRHLQNPPDVAGIARSQPVADADRVAAAATSAALQALAPVAGSWLVPGPTVVSDLCVSQRNDGFITSWAPTTCMRTVTAYFFFNGSFEQHMQAWDAALGAAGWRTAGYRLSQVLSMYTDWSHRPDPNEPGQRFLATSLPPSGAYLRALEGSPPPGQSVGLVFRWAQRPRATPSFVSIDGSSPGPSTVVAWIQKATVSPDAVESAAFTRYQFVVLATLTASYYVSAAPAQTPATTPTGGQ